MSEQTDERLRDTLARGFERRVWATAQSLRELADEIEREGARLREVSSPDVTSASALAGNIVHILAWGLANAKPDAIVSAAAEYDLRLNVVDQQQQSR